MAEVDRDDDVWADDPAPQPVRFVVVSGLPASGKSTLGRQLGPVLGLPVLDKDDLLVPLFTEDDDVDQSRRTRLSREADVLFQGAAQRALGGAVLVSFWRRPELSTTSGTPTEWLRSLGPSLEVFCECPPAVAASRFLSRRRHPGHGDAERREADLIEQFEALVRLGPLGIGRTITVDTTRPVEVDAIAARLLCG